jgi:hypothetical protein
VNRTSVAHLLCLLAALGCTPLPTAPRPIPGGDGPPGPGPDGAAPGDRPATMEDGPAPGPDAPAGDAAGSVDGPATGDAPSPGADGAAADHGGPGPDASLVDVPPPVTCGPGTHDCRGVCVINTNVTSCGLSCTPCPVPESGEATCDGTACGARCPPDRRLCGDRCVPQDDPASCGCPAGKHSCNGFCVADDSPTSCGSGCLPCPAPSGGTATCTNRACGFTCNDGYKMCGTECIPVGACCTSGDCRARANATVACDAARACVYTCAGGFHECGSACVANNDVATCGNRCLPCQAPTGGSVSCDGTGCQPACPMGKQICQGACIDSSMACAGTCPPGQRACTDGFCRANDVAACGASCSPCPVPSNGSATCDGTGCGVACNMGFRRCGNQCIPASACCAAGDCVPPLYTTPANGSATCGGSQVCDYTCNDGYKKCSGGCIRTTACCTAAECVPPLFTAPPSSTATCTASACGFNCNSGHRTCGSSCIPDSQCCSNADCPGDPKGDGICDSGTCGLKCESGYVPCASKYGGNACVFEREMAIDLDRNGTRDCEENVLRNGFFTAGAISWTASGASITWSGDADANEYQPASGSLFLRHSQTEPGGASQCVAMEGGQRYVLMGQFKFEEAATKFDTVRAEVTFFSDAGCRSGGVQAAPQAFGWGGAGLGWQTSPAGVTLTPPAGTRSAMVRLLVVTASALGGTNYSYFDNVLLHP